MFKATSDDYKSLNLVSEKYDMVVRYEEYINEGKYFEAQKKIDEEEIESINSNTIAEEEIESINSNTIAEEDDALKLKNSKIQSYFTNNKLILGVISATFIIIFLFILIIKKK